MGIEINQSQVKLTRKLFDFIWQKTEYQQASNPVGFFVTINGIDVQPLTLFSTPF